MLAVVVTFSSPHCLQTWEAIVWTTWYGILNPMKNPTIHLFHYAAFSSSMSFDTLRWCPTCFLGRLSRVNLVLESEILTLSAYKFWEVARGLLLLVFLSFNMVEKWDGSGMWCIVFVELGRDEVSGILGLLVWEIRRVWYRLLRLQGDGVIWMRVGHWDVEGGANRSIDLLFWKLFNQRVRVFEGSRC